MFKNRPLPIPTPETKSFWSAAAEKRLQLQQCKSCEHIYFPPRPFCPNCASRRVFVFDASGKETLYSYIFNHLPASGYDSPFVLAVVQLKEGPRMMCNIIDCQPNPELLQLDMELEVAFEQRENEISIPQFRPATGQKHG